MHLQTKRHRLLLVLALWFDAVILTVVSFYIIWDKWPDGSNFIWLAMTAPIALPTSFLHTVLLVQSPVLLLTGLKLLLVMAVFWIGVVYLQIKFVKTGAWRYFLGSGIIVFVAAIRWMYYAVGMSGI